MGHDTWRDSARLELIGRASLVRENEAWGSCGQEVFVFGRNNRTVPKYRIQLYCPKDFYKQNQWNILPVTMSTEIMNFNRLLRWLSWQ